jgi:hypothetical protein
MRATWVKPKGGDLSAVIFSLAGAWDRRRSDEAAGVADLGK